MKDIKTYLYDKFGNNINLEAEDSEDYEDFDA